MEEGDRYCIKLESAFLPSKLAEASFASFDFKYGPQSNGVIRQVALVDVQPCLEVWPG